MFLPLQEEGDNQDSPTAAYGHNAEFVMRVSGLLVGQDGLYTFGIEEGLAMMTLNFLCALIHNQKGCLYVYVGAHSESKHFFASIENETRYSGIYLIPHVGHL